MDTLTLDGKAYLSSKRAAEITGYAKDYIGQLCREGRVSARLVGRNWYILEASLQKHRFGADAAVAEPQKETEKIEEAEAVADSGPVLQADEESVVEVPMVAEAVEEEPSSKEESLSPEAENASQDIDHIQEAWKTWFNERGTQKDESLEPIEQEASTPDEALKEDETSEKDVIPVRVSTTHILKPVRNTASFDKKEGVRVISVETVKGPKRPMRTSDMLTVKAIAIAVAGLSICVAIIGTGVLDTLPVKNSFQALVLHSFGGITTVTAPSK